MIRSFARPYARAIFSVAETAERASRIAAELRRFGSALSSSEDLRGIFATPGVDTAQKESLIGELSSRLEISETSERTLLVLSRNRRINDLGAVLDALDELINEHLGIVTADVVSASDLDENEKERLKGALSQRFGREVELRLSTDANLLGGFVAKLGSEVYDASVRGRMNRMREKVT